MDIKPFEKFKKTYENLLFDDILPYWERHGKDIEYGGFLNCMRDNGELISEDKYLWSQGRGLWTYSYLYNNFGKDRKISGFMDKTADFLINKCFDSNYDGYYRVDRKGNILEGPISIYGDMFSVYGLVEYYRATGNQKILDFAVSVASRIAERIAQKDFSATAPGTIKPGMKAQGVSFLFLNILTPLLEEVDDPVLENAANECVMNIVNRHMDYKRKLNIEFFEHDYSLSHEPKWRDFVPGHGIECAWILMIEAIRKNDGELMKNSLTILKWHTEIAWDDEYGGIYWFGNIDHELPFEKNWQCKLWWPHVEALLALMLAFEISGEKWCWDWFIKIHDYSFRTFPDSENGEWKQRLDRKGNTITQTLVLPVKDPFHLPRAAMFVIESLARQIKRT
jgi:N-acylglucosamine 2-epimerase